MRLSPYALMVMHCLRVKNPDGTLLDLDQLLSELATRFGRVITKANLQICMRPLLQEGLIDRIGFECRRGRRRRLLSLTDLGELVLGPALLSEDGQPQAEPTPAMA